VTIAPGDTTAERAVRRARARSRDTWSLLAGLVGVAAAAWVYLFVEVQPLVMGSTTTSMNGMQTMMQPQVWYTATFGLMLLMWAVMMVAMMVPTAVPMTLVYAAIARKAAREGRAISSPMVFIAGYIVVWVAFSVAATVAQRGLDQWSLLSPAMALGSPLAGGVLLIAAGVYELTPLKRACLAHCRAPAHFISQHWHGGLGGAFRVGLSLGTYCLGCCWIIMGLLFVGGVMNLLWIAAIAVFVLLEKVLPFGAVGGRVVGVGMILVGLLSVNGFVRLG
jgi:predicted metal-binding membrane protein